MPSRVACCYRLGVSHFCAKIRNVKVFAKIRCIGEHVSGELGINNHFMVTFPKSWTVLKNAQTTNYISHVYHSFAVWNLPSRLIILSAQKSIIWQFSFLEPFTMKSGYWDWVTPCISFFLGTNMWRLPESSWRRSTRSRSWRTAPCRRTFLPLSWLWRRVGRRPRGRRRWCSCRLRNQVRYSDLPIDSKWIRDWWLNPDHPQPNCKISWRNFKHNKPSLFVKRSILLM